MSKLVKKVIQLLLLTFVVSTVTSLQPVTSGSAKAATASKIPVKKAKWNPPANSNKAKVKAKKASKYKTKVKAKKAFKYKAKAKKNYGKKAKSYKKPVQAKKQNKKPVKKTKKLAAKVPITDSTLKGPVLKAPKGVKLKTVKGPKPKPAKQKVLTVEPNLSDEDIDDREERSTSPLLIVFVTFVLCCIGGMFYLNNRKKQLEFAKSNFRETSNHEIAFSSRSETFDFMHSSNEAPTTRTLFERTDREQRHTSRQSAKKSSGFLGKLSSKASSLIRSSAKKKLETSASSGLRSQGDRKLFPESAEAAISQFDHEDTSFASITTIGAVRASTPRSDTRAPAYSTTARTSEKTLEPVTSTQNAEPCSFERYVEIQVAAQCWRAKKLALDPKLREVFAINTEELIQLEFYWKQKISGNINLRKKYQELEPLYNAKYDAA